MGKLITFDKDTNNTDNPYRPLKTGETALLLTIDEVEKTADFTAVANYSYSINSTASAIKIKFPASADSGATIVLQDTGGAAASNNITIRNSTDTATLAIINTNSGVITFTYNKVLTKWLISSSAVVVSTQSATKISGLVNAGVPLTLGNLKVQIPTSGYRSLQVATVSGTYSIYGAGTYVASGQLGAAEIDNGTPRSVTTTMSYIAPGMTFVNAGDTITWLLMDTSARISWRISLIVGGGYNNNMISIEQISASQDVVTAEQPQDRAVWSSLADGNNLLGGAGFTSSSSFGSVVYDSQMLGYKLTDGTGQTKVLTWNMSYINYAAPVLTFKTSVASSGGSGSGNAGDGIWMTIGASAQSTAATAPQGGIGVLVWIYNNEVQININGTNTRYPIPSPSYIWNSQNVYTATNNQYYDFSLVIKNIGGKRYLEVQINGSLIMKVNITTWTPAGNFITVGAYTGAAWANQYCRSILVNW